MLRDLRVARPQINAHDCGADCVLIQIQIVASAKSFNARIAERVLL